ncbi:MAG: NAD-dependent protein deacetylase sirtuin-1 isoform X1, partial [Hyperionvirus sp.]
EHEHKNQYEAASSLIKTRQKILVLTGAGIRVNAGIPDFRSKNGILAEAKISEEMFSSKFFCSAPDKFYVILKALWPKLSAATPTKTHKFIKLLEDQNKLLGNYTQNIDDLEKKAGIKNVFQCHGTCFEAICQKCSNLSDVKDLDADSAEKCPDCGSFLKPNIVFYDEDARFIKSLSFDADECDLLIIIGTSLKVNPVANVISWINPVVPIIVINKESIPVISRENVIELLGDCDEIVDALSLD